MLIAAEAHADHERDRGKNRASDDGNDGTSNDGGELFETHVKTSRHHEGGAAEQQWKNF